MLVSRLRSTEEPCSFPYPRHIKISADLQTMHTSHEPGCHSIQHAARQMLQYEALAQYGWRHTDREGRLQLGGIAQAPVKQQQRKKWRSSEEMGLCWVSVLWTEL